jgi:hypothetical protein
MSPPSCFDSMMLEAPLLVRCFDGERKDFRINFFALVSAANQSESNPA